ncbi:hypothetical protein NDU88_000685 [Pleurodeles waltl]|uniref:Uncharacterized protein n=1 Tax=Pleurodeles waltl TaxID=8319 RepID=A0AAV7L8V3_PLEWA|nr:hypothetical protein NDU88_000685 [Pleurodeles waltl]
MAPRTHLSSRFRGCDQPGAAGKMAAAAFCSGPLRGSTTTRPPEHNWSRKQVESGRRSRSRCRDVAAGTGRVALFGGKSTRQLRSARTRRPPAASGRARLEQGRFRARQQTEGSARSGHFASCNVALYRRCLKIRREHRQHPAEPDRPGSRE